MNERTRTGMEIITAALILGIVGNLMLRQVPWGFNAFIFVTTFTAGMMILTLRWRPDLLTFRTLSLQCGMIFFAAMFVIRDSIELRVYDTFAILVIMGVLVLPNFGINQRFSGAFHYIVGLLWAGGSSLIAPFILLGADVDWRKMPGNRLSRNVFSVLRGLAVALPLVLVFGALFMAADAAFENFANRAINFDVTTLVSHVLLTSGLAWLTAGYFRGTLVQGVTTAAPVETGSSTVPATRPEASDASYVDKIVAEPAENTSLPNYATVLEHINLTGPAGQEVPALTADAGESIRKKRDWQNWDNTVLPQVFTLGTVETIIILGLVDLLFLSFVVFQIPYLFGGIDFVQNTPELTLADFARRGFGELVAVVALVLPMLLVSHWLLRRNGGRTETIFRILAGIQIGLLFVIMASAMQRLVLLTGSLGYGWTTVRFYPMVFMIWLSVVFVWFGWTVLRGRRNNFAWGALWSALLILGATNLFNPDAFIARSNVDLAIQGREFDARYNSRLSDDAIPTLMASFESLSPAEQETAIVQIAKRYCEKTEEDDLRSWNYSRWLASNILRSNHELVMEIGDCRRYRRPESSD